MLPTYISKSLPYKVDLCSRTCAGPPFRSLGDAEAYLRRFTKISGYLHHLRFLTSAEVQVYLVAGLPFATRKDVEVQLPIANRGMDTPPTKLQVVNILCDLLRHDSFETFVTTRLFPTRSCSSLFIWFTPFLRFTVSRQFKTQAPIAPLLRVWWNQHPSTRSQVLSTDMGTR
jgi:hypothetical protein